jgi:TRAP-type mannitol/chloroaromatic compound transport system substrate-binding protein
MISRPKPLLPASSPPGQDIFHEYATDFAKSPTWPAANSRIEVLPSGAVVPAFQLLEAVNKGLDGGHGVVAITTVRIQRWHCGFGPSVA